MDVKTALATEKQVLVQDRQDLARLITISDLTQIIILALHVSQGLEVLCVSTNTIGTCQSCVTAGMVKTGDNISAMKENVLCKVHLQIMKNVKLSLVNN